jgi:hypothetical protein
VPDSGEPATHTTTTQADTRTHATNTNLHISQLIIIIIGVFGLRRLGNVSNVSSLD